MHTCQQIRESISARIDNETPPVEPTVIDAHLTSCADCARFADLAQVTMRTTRHFATQPAPDLTGRIVAAVRLDHTHTRDRRMTQLRVAVALLGLIQLLLAIPVLAGLTLPDLHAARHLGALQAGIGTGLLLAAWQPKRATGLLPVMVVTTTAIVISAAIEIATGHIHLTHELIHLTEIAAVITLWLLARRATNARPVPTANG